MASMMDFSHFNSAPQPYPYFPLQHSTASVTGDGIHFDHSYGIPNTDHDQFNSSFQNFNDGFALDTTNLPTSLQSNAAPTPYLAHTPLSPVQAGFDAAVTFHIGDNADDGGRPRSSSEEKDNATPQQNKRKAQNRAAQRAFRERKEKHLKDLEAKLNVLQQQSMTLDSENERLKKELAQKSAENEILKASTGGILSPDHDDIFGPMAYKPFSQSIKRDGSSNPHVTPTVVQLHTIVLDDSSGDPLLTSEKTWDYIQAHDLYKRGLVDIGDVCEKLKTMARCHGQGPVFREGDIRKALDESAVAGGRDELV